MVYQMVNMLNTDTYPPVNRFSGYSNEILSETALAVRPDFPKLPTFRAKKLDSRWFVGSGSGGAKTFRQMSLRRDCCGR